MTEVRALAYQVLMPGFGGTEAPAWLLDAARAGLGGVCYFGHNIETPDQVSALSAQLHEAGPVVIAVDEEGGTVTRLHARDGSPHVGAAVLGRADDLALTAEVCREIATEVRDAGIDLDLAPVADVSSDPLNPVIGVRAFGADPDAVARHVRTSVTAMQETGVIACAKHFPGHGDTNVDSHVGLPRIDVDLATLRRRDLVPFAAAVGAGARAVMTSHIVFPALDDRPATLSPPVLALLRDEVGFDGVIVSDAVDMRAIVDGVGFRDGVVQALAAGVDLVALGNTALGSQAHRSDEAQLEVAVGAIVDGVTSGALSHRRLEEAAHRIGELRAYSASARSRGNLAGAVTGEASRRAAARALHRRGDVESVLDGPVVVADLRRRRNVASGRLTDVVADELVRRLPGSRVVRAFARGDEREGHAGDEASPAVDVVVDADVALVGTPGRDGEEDAALAELVQARPDALVVCVGWSSDPDRDLPLAANAVFTFGESRPSAAALADLVVRGGR